MKKIFTTVAALLIMGSVAFAQDAKKATTTKTETKTMTSKHVKKDGTPDMRYKENKTMKTETKKTTTVKATK